MTEYAWTALRDEVIAACGDAPSAELEQRLLIVFRESPALVAAGIQHVLNGYRAGRVRSVWPLLVRHVEESAARGREVVVSDTRERERELARASAWMRAVGLYFDRWAEVYDELFGERGRVHEWAGDPEFVRELEELYGELRPLGLQTELEAEMRMRR